MEKLSAALQIGPENSSAQFLQFLELAKGFEPLTL